MDKITLKDQVGGTKNRVTLMKVDGAENTYDVYADRTGVTQVGDEITAAALMQIQDNAEQAIGDATGYDRVIPYAEGTQTTAKVISAPVEPAAERTAGLCVRVKMPAAFDETFYLAVSTWSAPIAAEESVTGYTPVWPAGIYTFTYNGTAWRLPLPMAAGTAYTNLRVGMAIESSAMYTDNAVDAETARAQQVETALNHTVRRSYSPALHGTGAGEAVHITDSAAESDFSRLAVIGRSTQDGEPAPDTPIAIAGVQPATVRVCGKNLADESMAKWANISGNPPALLAKSAAVGSTLTITSTEYRGIGVSVPVAPSAKYTVRMDGIAYAGNGSRMLHVGYYKSLKDVSYSTKAISRYSTNLTASDTSKSVSFTTPENCYAVVVAYAAYPVAANDTIRVDHITTMEGTEASYAPYAGTDYPLTLTTPMYSLPGGADEIDLVSGAETRRCGVITLDGTETWMVRKANATSASFSTPVSNVAIGAAYPAISTIGFRAGRYGVDGYEGTTSDSGTSSRPQISVLYSRIGSSAEDTDADKISKFKAWLASHPVTLVYQLANPVTADHARADIAQPTPEANVSADGAPVDVTYSRDLQTVIDTLQAAILAAGSN